MNTKTRMTVKNIAAGMTILVTIPKDSDFAPYALATSKTPATVTEVETKVINGNTLYYVATAEYGILNAASAQNKFTVVS